MIDLAPQALHHLLLAHIWLIYPLGHVYMEPELEVQEEQTQAKDFTNLVLDQGKLRCILPLILGFSFDHYNGHMLLCVLSL
jgi:hypothetical protein